MRAAFIHLSDIHFGQEKGDGELQINNDIKERLIDDCVDVLNSCKPDKVGGVLVTGDLAYAGKESEYEDAGRWLDRLTAAVGCKRTEVRIVPGNHDIDRSAITVGTGDMLENIAKFGQEKLDAYLKSNEDRTLLFGRFKAYQRFAHGYDCPLDSAGGWSGNHICELAPGRILRFIGVNSALICAKDDEKGRLLLGERQHVLNRAAGEELVVLTHHPLDWFQDSEAARTYLRSRARVYLSGHEHSPSVNVDQISNGTDLLMLAAGATVPPRNEKLEYSYNILEFECETKDDALSVSVHPRKWQAEETAFGPTTELLAKHVKNFSLGCPNFRRFSGRGDAENASSKSMNTPEQSREVKTQKEEGNFPSLLLRFFRDLSDLQRVAALVELEILPSDWQGGLTHSIERQCLDRLREQGGLDRLQKLLDRHLNK